MLTIHRFETHQAGPRLLILGGVHGNEVCGPMAMAQILPDLESGAIALKAGRLTLVPIANPRAHEENKRFIDRNLNRALRKREKPEKYEEHLMNELCPLLDDCDVLLDIHSYTAGGPPFAFCRTGEGRAAEEAFVASLCINHVVYGWEDAYDNAGVSYDPEESVGTTEYARRAGAQAVTIECGQHRDAEAPAVALRAIKGALKHTGLAPHINISPVSHLRRTRMKQLVYKERNGGFTKDWQHLDAIKKGEHLATYEDGAPLFAPFDGRIVMPNAKCPVGQEWFYLGVDE